MRRFPELIERRDVLKGSLALMVARFLAPARGLAQGAEASLRFAAIEASSEDAVRVPPGYTARVLARWGDPVGGALDLPEFKPDASNTAEEQAAQFGMHHDGMAFFPLPAGSADAAHGVLAVNHEYIDRGLLHPAQPGWSGTPEQVRKEINAHGVSICEVERVDGEWRVRRPSRFARRITAETEMRLGGPVRGHRLARTSFEPKGERVWGTLNNCAAGRTPWGTFLTCEENWDVYFSLGRTPTDEQRRYGIGRGAAYDWAVGAAGDLKRERFDLDRHPNEANRFGWVVEIDPYDPASVPVKRTALGRFKHENAAVTLARDGRVVVYMGDDGAGEYIYKFVSRGRYARDARKAPRELLDEGTLYAAQFRKRGRGSWLPLTPQNPALSGPRFPDLASLLVNARLAADAAGGTRMDRPEWIAIEPASGAVYCTLTNNGAREQPDSANPRARNAHGHIVRWRERDPGALSFTWDVFVLAGDPGSASESLRGDIRGDLFSAPDGLAFDARGVLWIQTDVAGANVWHPRHAAERREFRAFGNNQMLAVAPSEGVMRRFLTGPVGAEITGFAMTPDGRTLFVNVQHPGEPLSRTVSNDPADPTRFSRWPDGGRPRSATLVITKDDGGVIGT